MPLPLISVVERARNVVVARACESKRRDETRRTRQTVGAARFVSIAGAPSLNDRARIGVTVCA
jgi:hypothetical protein